MCTTITRATSAAGFLSAAIIFAVAAQGQGASNRFRFDDRFNEAVRERAEDVTVRGVSGLIPSIEFGCGRGRFPYLGSSKSGVFVAAGNTVWYEVPVPEQPWFDAQLVAFAKGETADFRLLVEDEHGRTVAAMRKLEGRTDWHRLRIDFSAWSGKTVRIGLNVASGERANIGFWANPILYTERPRTAAPLPNLLLYIVDGIGADHIDLYGYGLPTAPNLRLFSKQAATFERCYAATTNGTLALSALLQMVDSEFRTTKQSMQNSLLRRVRAAGFETPAITQQETLAPEISEFLDFAADGDAEEADASPAGFKRAARRYLEQPRYHPFVFVVLDREPAGRRRPPIEYVTGLMDREAGDASVEVAVYNAAIRRADERFGAVLEAFRETNYLDNTIILFASTHGEGFGSRVLAERRLEPFEPQCLVPLLIRIPGLPAQAIVGINVSTWDIAPTILSLLNLFVPPAYPGLDLRPVLRGEIPSGYRDRLIAVKGESLDAIIAGKYKLLIDSDHRPAALYQTLLDPAERNDLASTLPAIVSQLLQSQPYGLSQAPPQSP